jgi:glycosyltransferase involved in cell wall biosynthesis
VLVLVDRRNRAAVSEDTNPVVLTWPSYRPTRVVDARWLFGLLRRERPAAIVANFGGVNLSMSVGAALGVPIRVAWYRTLRRQIDLDGPQNWRVPYQRLRKRAVYRLATLCATASNEARLDLAAGFAVAPERIEVWGHSVQDPGIESKTPEPGHIVCAGRLYPSKGQDVLLRALALEPSVHVSFAGDGPARATLVALAAELGVLDRCHFLGAIPRALIPALMARAVVTVVPSRDEAFGLVNIESLAVGTPVVASRVGGIPEIVRDGVEGLLVPPDDPAALAKAIHRILESPRLRSGLSEAGRMRFLSSYEQGRVVRFQADRLEELARALSRRVSSVG